MNKKKTLLLVLLSLLCAFTLAFAVGCANPDDSLLQGNYKDEADVEDAAADDWVLQYITLNTNGVTTEYNLGTAFDAVTKPTVTARFVSLESLTESIENPGTGENEVQLVTKDEVVTTAAVMDYTQFNKDAVGVYTIYVSYKHANISRSASFDVKVKGVEPANGGITISKAVTSYTIGQGEKTKNIALDDITVQKVSLNTEGDEVVENLTADDYELSFFKDGVTSVTAEDLATAGKGAYTIRATAGNSTAQVVVNVLNPVAAVALKTGDDSIKTTQVQSPVESMTETWIFVVTYNNGDTIEVKKGDAGLLIGNVITVVEETAGSVGVVYTEDADSVNATVNYTVTKNPALLNESVGFNRDALGISSGDVNLTQSHLKGDNSFLTRGDANNVVLRYRAGTDSGVLEIRYDAVKVTFLGFGTLTVSARSTGSSNISSLALKNKDGKYISAVYDTTDEKIGKGVTENGEIYTVSGDLQKDSAGKNIPYMARILTFIIPEAGEYTLCTVDEVPGEPAVATNRNTRVYKIDKLDVFDNTIDRTNYTFDVNTDNVKKDYVSGVDTEVSLTGIVASFNEVHTVDTNKNKSTDVSANVTAEVTSGNLTEFGKTATVTVKYAADDGKEYTETYTVNVLSPVTGVNSVVAVKAAVNYTLPDAETTTYTIPDNDFTLRKNTASGEEITLGDGESATYELYDSEGTKLDSWTVGVGTYTIKVKVVLNKTAAGATGTVEFTPADIKFTVNAYVPAGSTKKGTTSYAVTAHGTDELYTLESSDDTDNVATLTWVSGAAKEQAANEKTINDVTYTHCINVNGGGRYITLMLNENIISAKITVICGSSNAGRSVGLFKGNIKAAADSNAESALGSATIDTAGGATSFTVTVTEGGEYTITAVTTGSTATVRVYGIIIEYELNNSGEQTANLLDYDMYVEEK